MADWDDGYAKGRADERERNAAEVEATAKWCREDERATLRAKVEAIPTPGVSWHDDWVRRSDVLTLFDGET